MNKLNEEESLHDKKFGGTFFVSVKLFEELEDLFTKMLTKKSVVIKESDEVSIKSTDPLRQAFTALLSHLLFDFANFNFRDPSHSGEKMEERKLIVAKKIQEYLFKNKILIQAAPAENKNPIRVPNQNGTNLKIDI